MEKENYWFIIVFLLIVIVVLIGAGFAIDGEIDRIEMVLGNAICHSEQGKEYSAYKVHVSQGLIDEAWYEVRCEITDRKIVNNR